MPNLASLAEQFRLIPARMHDAISEKKSNSAGEAAAIAGRLLVQAIEAGLFNDRPDVLLAVEGGITTATDGSGHGRTYCRAVKVLLNRTKGPCAELVADGCPAIADCIDRLLASQATIPTADPTGRLSIALERFNAVLQATTSVADDGVRTIGPAPHAITLSQVTDALHKAIGEAMPMALAGDDQSLFAALVEASQATGWPTDRHNRAQADGWPHRWEPGETIASDMLEAIEKARTLAGDFPLRSGYHKPAPAEVMDAVRKVIADWDGTNWSAVRAVLEHAGQSPERINAMTLDDVRQYFAVGQRRIVMALGGQPFTATHTIVSSSEPPATISVPRAGSAIEPKPGQGERPMKAASTGSMSKEAKALAALTDHPDWTDEQIAEAAGCARTALYRMSRFKQARAIQRSANVPRGSKGKSGEIEAWDDEE